MFVSVCVVCVLVCARMCLYVRVCACMYVSVCVCVCMYVCVGMRARVCVCACVCLCLYVKGTAKQIVEKSQLLMWTTPITFFNNIKHVHSYLPNADGRSLHN